jgi:hypothetical protein
MEILGEYIREMKFIQHLTQHGKCDHCHKDIPSSKIYESHLAHRIPKSKANLKKYGKDIIHHPLNIPLVCGDNNNKCNNAVLIGEKPIRIMALVAEIKQAIREGL